MPEVSINLASVVVATIAAMVVGSVWYSPLLFVKAWMKETGHSMDVTPEMKAEMPKAMFGQLVATFILAYILARVLAYSGAQTVVSGIEAALMMWLGFQATGAAAHVFFERKSWTWFAINAGCSFVIAIIMGAIIGGWRW